MRTIAVVTGSRADYGIYRPVLRAIDEAPDLRLRVMACGMHLARSFGHTVDQIEADGFPIGDRVTTLMASDTPEGIAKSTAWGIAGFAQSFAAQISAGCPPDLLVVLGDRYEMFAAAAAALPFAIPIAHLHGGERTEGAIDEALRHAITKMSHLHFVATDEYCRRVIQMGEQPERVFTVGAPGLDAIGAERQLGRDELERRIGLRLDRAPLLVTFHPVTLQYGETLDQVDELLAALEPVEQPIVFTHPNADTSAFSVVEAVRSFANRHANACLVADLGTEAYASLMGIAAAMVGNSSSGIIEAASFQLPVVNVGDRQRGRLRGANVIDAAPRRDAITEAMGRALSPAFRASLGDLVNPYGDGHAAPRIVEILRRTPLDRTLIEKRFYDLPHNPAVG
jgi:UDP-hydrolysing UDP-N-acetyl-D-glucosamine 2-epimerase